MPTLSQIPFVEYLVLDDGAPHLVAQQCTKCGARFFDRRNACPACFNTEFSTLRMKIKLTTTSMGADSQGVEAINYAFEPV